MKKTSFGLAAALAVALAAGGSTVGADEPAPSGSYLKVAMTTVDEYSRDPKTRFAPDTPAIYAVYRVAAAGPLKLKTVFWADAVEGLEPRTKLLEKDVSIRDKGEYMGAVPALKPPNGWPVGSYHVEFLLDEKSAKSLPFRVEKAKGTP